jgi:hypothetical protein
MSASSTATSPGSTPAPKSAPAAQYSACRTSQLRITLTSSGAATAIVGGYIGFKNLASAPCQLDGYPTLVGVTAAGDTVTATQLLTSMFGPNLPDPPQVTLGPGALAEAVFTGNEVAGSCASGPLPTFQTLRVTPPGNTQSATISAWLPAVGTYLPDCGEITVSPVVPSADLYNLQSS